MNSTLFLLRALTLIASTLLVTGLFAWIAIIRNAPARASRAAWLLIAGVQCALLVNSGVGELLTAAREWLDNVLIWELSHRFYYVAYLTNGILDALLPAALLMLCLRAGWGRKSSVLLALGIVSVGVIAIERGALRDWQTLMTVMQVTSLLGIAGYLAFCGLYILKRLVGVDHCLAGYVAIAAGFHLVLPIQEAVFQAVGQALVVNIWHVNQILQAVRLSAQFAIVLACIISARRGLAPSSAYSVRVS